MDPIGAPADDLASWWTQAHPRGTRQHDTALDTLDLIRRMHADMSALYCSALGGSGCGFIAPISDAAVDRALDVLAANGVEIGPQPATLLHLLHIGSSQHVIDAAIERDAEHRIMVKRTVMRFALMAAHECAPKRDAR